MLLRNLTFDVPFSRIEAEFEHHDGLLDELGSLVDIDVQNGTVHAITLLLHSQTRVALVARRSGWTAYLPDDDGRVPSFVELARMAGFPDNVAEAWGRFNEVWEVTTGILAQIADKVIAEIKDRVISDINCVTTSVPF